MDELKRAVAEAVAKAAKIGKKQAEALIETPKDSSLGDYAFPCFALAKKLRKNPAEIAAELKSAIKESGAVKKVECKGPYLNFFAEKSGVAQKILERIYEEKDSFGSMNIKNKEALVEHTSINPNAPPHIGRARNAIIGDSIAKLLKFAGYKTQTHFFVNDIGKQIAVLVYGCKGKKRGFNELLRIYVETSKKMETSPELEQELFSILKKLESGDKKTVQAFRRIVDACVEGQAGTFADLGINYDFFDYESAYLWSRETSNVLEKLKKTGKVFEDKEGRRVLDLKEFDLPMKSPVMVLTRADKTSLYGLRDIAYTIDKIKKGKDRNIVVLGEDHKLYFRQLTAALSLLGYRPPEAIHYSFILLQSEKMSTRKGNVVLLEDFMKEAKEKAKKEILKRNRQAPKKELDQLAKAVGYGAVKFSIIKVSPEKNVLFDWQRALSFEGESAPYIQYAHARIKSILRKNRQKTSTGTSHDYKEEEALVMLLAGFPETVSRATAELKPHIIANYALKLAEAFNTFYHKYPVLRAEKQKRDARLLLIECVAQTLKNALYLLGIKAPEKM